MYLENAVEIFYSKTIENKQDENEKTFSKMQQKGMVSNMKNWRKLMAGLCAAAMVGSMVVPVWASDDAAEEEADGDVADVTEALVGLWKDSAGDIYGFYNDYSFFGQWVDEEQDVLGAYALASDGDYTALVMQFANDDGTYDEENEVSYLVQAGETDAGETFIYASNDDGSFCSVLVIDQDDNYVSFVGEGTLDEENAIVTITDEVSEMSLGFGVEANDDGSLTLDMGDLGNATVEESTIAVAVQGLKYAVENGTPMN